MAHVSTQSIRQAIGQKILLAFIGQDEIPLETLRILETTGPAGFSLFRNANLRNPAQARSLTGSLQAAARRAGLPHLLIAADQEGGQVLAVGEGATPFPGSMALGAAASEDLARRTGQAVGLELAAMGINLNFSPLLDLLSDTRNTMLGARSFGQDPHLAGQLGAAYVQGLQSAGVAATARHFPGLGDVSPGERQNIPLVPHTRERLFQVELPPFEAAIRAGVKLVMAAHVAIPALNGGRGLPATHSAAVLGGLLRGEMGFDGLVITDALDMKSSQPDPGLLAGATTAFAAGVDLLLLGPDGGEQQAILTGLVEAAQNGLLDASQLLASAGRVQELKQWLSRHEQPPLEVVGCPDHQALALETARRSITLVRDAGGLLPLHLDPDQRILLLTPQPTDLTPSETSSHTTIRLHHEVRQRHPKTDWLVVPPNPTYTEITAILERAEGHALVIVGTFNAIDLPGQTSLVRLLLKSGIPTVVAAMRTPFDLLAFPTAPVYLCTYGIQPPSLQALAEVLFGEIPFQGRLPVQLPGV